MWQRKRSRQLNPLRLLTIYGMIICDDGKIKEYEVDFLGILSPNDILNITSALIVLGIFLHSLLHQNQGNIRGSRSLYVLLAAIFLTAAFELFINIHLGQRQYHILLLVSMVNHIFFPALASIFSVRYLQDLSGKELIPGRKRLIFGIPLAAEVILYILTLLSYKRGSFIPSGNTRFYLMLSMKLIASCFILAAIVLLWKMDKTLLMLPIFLIVTWIYFSYTAYFEYLFYVDSLFLAISVLYIYLSVMHRGILVQIGAMILAILVMMTLFIGNSVTSAAVISYLEMARERIDRHLGEIQENLEQYKALGWLFDYWVSNPGDVKLALEQKGEEEAFLKGDDNPFDIDEEEAKALPLDLQLQFAVSCYRQIGEYLEQTCQIHDLDNLRLVLPTGENSAVTIYNVKESPEDPCMLGEPFDLEKESFGWLNVDSTLDYDRSWTWGMYTNIPFGFRREVPLRDGETPAILCTVISGSKIAGNAKLGDTMRFRTIVYLSVAVLGILLMLYVMILRPLSVISSSIKKYEDTKDSDMVAGEMARIRFSNEIGAFANEFALLTKEMDRYTADVAALAGEKERVKTELRMAADIQLQAIPSVFPAFPERDDFDIYAYMKPAKEVGGDFYDFFLTDENHLAFIIADVSDKGIPAALFMMSAKNFINYRAKEGGTPGEILTDTSNQLSLNNNTMMFITAWLGILDLESGVVTYTNAGHDTPLISDAEGKFSFTIEDRRGPAICMIPGSTYESSKIQMEEGGCIFLYTDGVKEAADISGNFFGEDRLLEALSGKGPGDPKNLVEAVAKKISLHVRDAQQFDDITMLCLKYKGKGASNLS